MAEKKIAVDVAVRRATKAIERVCRKRERGGGNAVEIGDLATWEIEKLIVDAVEKALRKDK